MKKIISVLVLTILSACGGGGSGSSGSGSTGTTTGTTTTTTTYSISGTVSGLSSGKSVTLSDNASDTDTVSSNGTTTFSTALAANSTYAVTVTTQPVGEICTVSNGTGTTVSADVTNISVVCSVDTYTVSGTATGLTGSGAKVTLQINGADPVTATAAQPGFQFSVPVAYGSSYAVTVVTDPTTSTCTVAHGSGSNVQANVSNIAISCAASTEQVFYAFTGGTDGAAPDTLLQASDGNFYGTTYFDGSATNGVLFKITSAGSLTPFYSNQDGLAGYNPIGLFQASDNSFYMINSSGGTNYNGVIVNLTSGAVATALYNYATAGGVDGTNGAENAGLIQIGTDLYGTESSGGGNGTGNGDGSVYKIDASGNRTTFYAFGAVSNDGTIPVTLIKGINGDTNLYGVTTQGGANNEGTIFQITSAGVESVLYSFSNLATDGRNPVSIMIASDGNFYGLTNFGGDFSTTCQGTCGAVFKFTPGTNGAAGVETILHFFANTVNTSVYPVTLIQASDGNFYGVASADGASTSGSLFEITSAGAYSLLYSFGSQTNDGTLPGTLLQGTDGHFYGVTRSGGSSYGTVFKF